MSDKQTPLQISINRKGQTLKDQQEKLSGLDPRSNEHAIVSMVIGILEYEIAQDEQLLPVEREALIEARKDGIEYEADVSGKEQAGEQWFNKKYGTDEHTS